MSQIEPKPSSKDLFRIVAIGSVDDGKSTLIGRLLYESGAIYQDQLDAMSKDGIDFAALTDGLAAEREQGITIDVAYRFWDTPQRRFIIADTPGHLQYTRNMVTGSSLADAAIILIDAKLGVLEQSKRHAYIATLLGVKTLLVAVNKMDTVNHDQKVFASIQKTFEQDLATMGNRSVHRFVPISALHGDNVVSASKQMPWYQGQTLLAELEQAKPSAGAQDPAGMVLPIQTVIRAPGHRRGYAGTVLCDDLREGDNVVALPSGKVTRIAKVINPSNQDSYAKAHSATQVQLQDELDLSRGEVLVAAQRPVQMHRHIFASLVWMHQNPLAPARNYFIKLSTKQCSASITKLVHRMDLQTLSPVPSQALGLNEIAKVELMLSEPCLVEPYAENKDLGCFVLIDRESFSTVGAGMIEAVASNATTSTRLTHEDKARRFAQRGAHVLLLGDPEQCREVAVQLESHLFTLGHLAYAMPSLHPDPKTHVQVVQALLDSGQIVIGMQSAPTPAGWPRVELTLASSAQREAQLDALVLELGAHGVLGPKSSSPKK